MGKISRALLALLVGSGLAAATLFFVGWQAQAQTLTQTDTPAITPRYVAATGNDTGDCSLAASPCRSVQYAVDQAAGGDEIRVAEGEYTGINNQGGLAQVVYITKDISIQGGYPPGFTSPPDPLAHPTTLDAGGLGRVIAILGPSDVSIEGLRLKGGNAAGLRGDPGNSSANAGGGLYVYSATLDIRNSVIFSNTASTESSKSGLGGGIFLHGSRLSLDSSTLEWNLGSPVYYGRGGGIYIADSQAVTLTGSLIRKNTGSTNQGNAGGGQGGGIVIDGSPASLVGNTIRENTASTGPGNLSFASGGGVYIYGSASKVSFIQNTIANNIASVKKEGWGGGLSFFGGSTASLVENTIQGNTASSAYATFGQGGGVYFSNGTLTMTGNLVQNNQGSSGGSNSFGWGGGIFLVDSQAQLASNIIASNQAGSVSSGSGGGLYIGTGNFTMVNNMVVANQANRSGSGMFITLNSGHLGHLVHNTFADNAGSGEGIYADSQSRLVFTNTVISGHTSAGITGTQLTDVSFESTLWHANGSDRGGSGAYYTHHNYSGDPAYVAPFSGDYHLSAGSAAIDKGIDAQVASDIDSQPRPNGAAPDLGADEYYRYSGTTSAEKVAFEPQWFVLVDPGSGTPQSYLSQRYLLQFRHNDPAGLVARITDTLPAELSLWSQVHTPAMDFQMQAAGLIWQTQQPLPAGQAAQILLTAVSGQVSPMSALTNIAEVRAGAWHFDLQASSQAPLFPPLFKTPGNGEVCPGNLDISGNAYPNASVKIYENGVEKALTTADASGAFSLTYLSAAIGYTSVDLTAVACLQSAPSQCSNPGAPVTLAPPMSFVCPQRSSWENTPASGPLAGQKLNYRFLDKNGKFAGDGGVFYFVAPHINSQIHVYRRSCEQMGTPPGMDEHIWVEFEKDGSVVAVYQPASKNLPWYHFDIDMELADVQRKVNFYLACTPPVSASGKGEAQLTSTLTFSTSLETSFDQDGTIFDVTGGFDPGSPSLHAVEGVTVTAMVSLTEWGGWVPWPAHLYSNQENPQVTGADGYFAYFSPPGWYYLQVDGGDHFQSWRSPALAVAAQPFNLNVPLTPKSPAANQVVRLGLGSPIPAVVTIAAGNTVEWRLETDGSLPLDELMRQIDNPAVRVLSNLDPLANVMGFDSGMLVPGGSYRRRFSHPGKYTYTDGAGHSGQIVVVANIYLPYMVR